MSSDDERGCASGIKVGDDMEAAELRDEILFKQPESTYLGDCPICCLPLIHPLETPSYSCCGKRICKACNHANQKREKEGRLGYKCPFCRHPAPTSEEERKINHMKRADANDPFALYQMGIHHHKEGDYKSAFDYLSRAAALGDVDAHFLLSYVYRDGRGVEEEKNEKKELYHLEEAAIAGHVLARSLLANIEGINGRNDRAIKHWIIAANLGDDASLELLKDNYAKGFVAKDDFAAALRGHHAAVNGIKSPHKEEAGAVRQKMETARAARQK